MKLGALNKDWLIWDDGMKDILLKITAKPRELANKLNLYIMQQNFLG